MSSIILSGNIIINSDNTQIYLLYRKDHQYYETPGGKAKPEEIKDNSGPPTLKELEKVAERELFEEVDGIKEIVYRRYYRSVTFKTPDGREAIAHKFIIKIKGELKPKEDIFDLEKSRWLRIKDLEKYPLSPDLKLLVERIKKYFGKH